MSDVTKNTTTQSMTCVTDVSLLFRMHVKTLIRRNMMLDYVDEIGRGVIVNFKNIDWCILIFWPVALTC